MTLTHLTELCAPDPSYRPLRDGLRAAGHWLDAQDWHLSLLCLTPAGVTVGLRGDRARDSLVAHHLAHPELALVTAEARAQRGYRGLLLASRDGLFPTGYEDALRLLGALAEDRGWDTLRLVIVDHYLLVSPASSREEPFVLDRAGMHALLDDVSVAKRAPGRLVDEVAEAAYEALQAQMPWQTVERAVVSDREAHYAPLLAGLGLLLDEVDGRAPAVADVDGGLLAAYTTPQGTYEVRTLSGAEMARQEERAARGRGGPLCRQLRDVGAYLDAQGAAAVVAQGDGRGGWMLEYAGLGDTRTGAGWLGRIGYRLQISSAEAGGSWRRWLRR